MVHMPTLEEIAALRQALSEAIARGEQATRRSEELAGELRVVRTERDLLQEQLNRFKRQLFDPKSEVSAAHQKDLFFNEAEVEGAQALIAHLVGMNAGRFTRIDIDFDSGLAEWVESLGLLRVDAPTSMVRGTPLAHDANARLYAIVTQALG